MTVAPSPIPPVGSGATVRIAPASPPRVLRIALLGNPNTGKTTLFNRLSGLRHKTSNFPGTTLEARVGRIRVARLAEGPRGDSSGGPELGGTVVAELIDLPGIYSLELEQMEAEICRAV